MFLKSVTLLPMLPTIFLGQRENLNYGDFLRLWSAVRIVSDCRSMMHSIKSEEFDSCCMCDFNDQEIVA